jgi:hypothetical protein
MYQKLSENKPCAKHRQVPHIMQVHKSGMISPTILSQIFGRWVVYSMNLLILNPPSERGICKDYIKKSQEAITRG